MFQFLAARSKNRRRQNAHAPFSRAVERLEDRTLLTTFNVVNLSDAGSGSLRQAILNANSTAGADVIDFQVAGTIALASSLPTVIGVENIDGTSAPGFAGAPQIGIDFTNHAGLKFGPGSAGSSVQSLALFDSSTSGLTLSGAGSIVITGNDIGLRADGTTLSANRANGIELDNSSGNTIGGTTAADRNVISANAKNGILLNGSSSNSILGNYIGTDATGTLDRGNHGDGILVSGASTHNTIGGSPGNVISGNLAYGVLISGRTATNNTVSGNLIGVTAAGNAALGNHLDGVRIDGSSSNTVGNTNPVSSVSYYNADQVPTQPVSGWQGIRGGDTSGQYLISGTSGNNGLLFEGTINGVGTSYTLMYPNAYATSVYGPDDLGSGQLRLVGSYRNSDFATAPVEVNSFLFQGTTADLANASDYTQVDYPGAKYTYVHSTMGDLAVGNYDSPTDHGQDGLPLGPGHAFIYNVTTNTFVTDIAFPSSLSNTAYGIWYNGGTSYTICGGYSLSAVNNFANQDQPIGKAYLVDYDTATGKFTNWKSFSYPGGTNYVTHFEGISSVEKGVYTLNADSVQSGSSNPTQGSFVSVVRNADGTFGNAQWTNLNYTGIDPTTHITSSNSVYGDQVVGIVIGSGGGVSYQATVNSDFQLSNVISANGGNGISLNAATNNQIAMNEIGTDETGSVDLGNAQNGIVLTNGSAQNTIGGEATGGNDPTNGVFVRPPDGNLISGNNADGVLITSKSINNQLSGNWIGTSATGNSALGNALDGVAIVNANNNTLLGCTALQDPFVFYNVLSGNGGNGLCVSNSNGTTIQANFFGVGADNATALGNAQNGVLVEGTSSHTTMGGPIPLGNVDAANGQNGVLVKDKASYFTSYNTFCGLAAFSDSTTLGNGADGILVTSTGGNILLRTNVITENHNDGVEISGAAQGVRVMGNIIGLNTNGFVAMGNLNNGVEVDGTAHNNIIIGGPQPTFNVVPRNAISANGNNGVAIDGKAHNITVTNGYIGTNISGAQALGNQNAGVFVGAGTSANVIGSTDPTQPTVISGNLGDGVKLQSTTGNTVQGAWIGTDATGALPLANAGDGIHLIAASKNTIGGVVPGAWGGSGGPANTIAFNDLDGVFVQSGSGNSIRGNSIHSNGPLGIGLASGANANQAAPVLNSVQSSSQQMLVNGTLTSTPSSAFTVDFFANDANEPSGRVFLGSQNVKSNASGLATISFHGPLPPSGANFITATATNAAKNTSEFSAAIS
jgi:trimeric autotransporter adhesin